jgi:hypothetical protein
LNILLCQLDDPAAALFTDDKLCSVSFFSRLICVVAKTARKESKRTVWAKAIEG